VNGAGGMAEAEIIPLGEGVQNEIRRELAKAKARFGDDFEILCFEGSWGDTLDDRQMLRMLRYLNRTGSMYREVICQI
jgi:hypothetical protein